MNENLVAVVESHKWLSQDTMLVHATFISAHVSILEQFLLVSPSEIQTGNVFKQLMQVNGSY